MSNHFAAAAEEMGDVFMPHFPSHWMSTLPSAPPSHPPSFSLTPEDPTDVAPIEEEQVCRSVAFHSTLPGQDGFSKQPGAFLSFSEKAFFAARRFSSSSSTSVPGGDDDWMLQGPYGHSIKRARTSFTPEPEPEPTPVGLLLRAAVQHADVMAALEDQLADRPVDFAAAHEHVLQLARVAFTGARLPGSAFCYPERTSSVFRLLGRLEAGTVKTTLPGDPKDRYLESIVAVLRQLHDEEPEMDRAGGSLHLPGKCLRRVLSSALSALVTPRAPAAGTTTTSAFSSATSSSASSSSSPGAQHQPKHLNALLETFLRNVLHPVALSSTDHTHVVSVVALANLLTGSALKLPREVVDSTLRPALVRFCDFKKRTPSLVAGMHHAIELFPALFSSSFADKLISTLRDDFLGSPSSTATAKDTGAGAAQPAAASAPTGQKRARENPTCPMSHQPVKDMAKMACLIVDTFRVFSLNSTFDCGSKHVPDLCALVGSLAKSLPSPAPGGADYQADLDQALCGVLYHHPATAADCLVGARPVACPQKGSANTAAARAAVQRVVGLAQAHPLRDEIARRSGRLLGRNRDFADAWRTGVFADVTLLAGEDGRPTERIAAHRVVLSQQSPYFHALLTNGMRESRDKDIHVECDAAKLRLLLEWMYTGNLRIPSAADEVIDLFMLADQLGLEQPCNACERALADTSRCLTEDSVEHILQFAEWRNQLGPGEVLLQTCKSYVLSRMGRVNEKLLRSTLTCSVSFRLQKCN